MYVFSLGRTRVLHKTGAAFGSFWHHFSPSRKVLRGIARFHNFWPKILIVSNLLIRVGMMPPSAEMAAAADVRDSLSPEEEEGALQAPKPAAKRTRAISMHLPILQRRSSSTGHPDAVPAPEAAAEHPRAEGRRRSSSSFWRSLQGLASKSSGAAQEHTTEGEPGSTAAEAQTDSQNRKRSNSLGNLLTAPLKIGRSKSVPLGPHGSRHRQSSAADKVIAAAEAKTRLDAPWRDVTIPSTPYTQLTTERAQHIASLLPPSAQIGDWDLAYSSRRDGYSLQSLYRGCAEKPKSRLLGEVLVVNTPQKEVFGAYSRLPFHRAGAYAHASSGNGEAFLFTLAPEANVYRYEGEGMEACVSCRPGSLPPVLVCCVSHSGSNDEPIHERLCTCVVF